MSLISRKNLVGGSDWPRGGAATSGALHWKEKRRNDGVRATGLRTATGRMIKHMKGRGDYGRPRESEQREKPRNNICNNGNITGGGRGQAKWQMQRGAEDASKHLNPTTTGNTGRIRHGICPGAKSRKLNIGTSVSATAESEEERERERSWSLPQDQENAK